MACKAARIWPWAWESWFCPGLPVWPGKSHLLVKWGIMSAPSSAGGTTQAIPLGQSLSLVTYSPECQVPTMCRAAVYRAACKDAQSIPAFNIKSPTCQEALSPKPTWEGATPVQYLPSWWESGK